MTMPLAGIGDVNTCQLPAWENRAREARIFAAIDFKRLRELWRQFPMLLSRIRKQKRFNTAHLSFG